MSIYSRRAPRNRPPLPRPKTTTKTKQDQDGRDVGVAGGVERLASRALSSQPLAAFDWSPDRLGLFVAAAYDQALRVGVVTKLHTLL
jgi:hypothetical protein